MFNLVKKYKIVFVIGILCFFGATSSFAYVTCLKSQCNVEKSGGSCSEHSCCKNKAVLSLKQAPRCDCRIGVPQDFDFDDKKSAMIIYPGLFIRDFSFVDTSAAVKDVLSDISLLFKPNSIPIFLKDCSFLI